VAGDLHVAKRDAGFDAQRGRFVFQRALPLEQPQLRECRHPAHLTWCGVRYCALRIGRNIDVNTSRHRTIAA